MKRQHSLEADKPKTSVFEVDQPTNKNKASDTIEIEEVPRDCKPSQIVELALAEKYRQCFKQQKSVIQESQIDTNEQSSKLNSPRHVNLPVDRKNTAPAGAVRQHKAPDFKLGVTGKIRAYGVSLLNQRAFVDGQLIETRSFKP